MTTSIPIQIRHSTLYPKKIGSYYIVRDWNYNETIFYLLNLKCDSKSVTEMGPRWRIHEVFQSVSQGLYSISGETYLSARSCEVPNPRDSCLDFSNRSEIWQAHRQQYCSDAWQISERYDDYNIQFSGFEASRDLVVRRLTT